MNKTPINASDGFDLLKKEFKKMLDEHDGAIIESRKAFVFPNEKDLRVELFVKLTVLEMFYDYVGFEVIMVPGECIFYIEEE